jgi:elongator complex protein 3
MNKQKEIIEYLLEHVIEDEKTLTRAKRLTAKKFKIHILSNAEVFKYVNEANIKIEDDLRNVLKKRAVRTMSGVAPVAVLTKPYPCPGKCVYCPTEKDVPQSYLSNEPAVMRAIRCNYEPFLQVQDRIRALIANGHEPTKIELIVIGGTWSYFPEKYKYWYILNCFAGANQFVSRKCSPADAGVKAQSGGCRIRKYGLNLGIRKLKEFLLLEQRRNEKAKYKIIGLTLETRPDYINDKELLEMRILGATRVEIGVQAIDDKILKLNKRGSDVKDIVDATKLLKDYGFKVTYHIMPGLPGSTAPKDYKMYQQLFSDARFQPDQIKFYPTVVTRGSLLYRWWKDGKYKPYSDKVLKNLIIKCKLATPEYVRIIRLIRDIPGESIIAGNKITNLRQIIKDEGVKCRCIRCREARGREFKAQSSKCQIIKYQASGGQEYFMSYESEDRKILYGFCRLRLVDNKAIIRELHVYGQLVSIGEKKRVQHAGLGQLLLKEAEKIAEESGFKKIVVISGVGVRGYYRKFGYRLKETYMLKNI